MLEKSEALGEEESRDMSQKLMGLESTRVRNASLIVLTIAKTGAQAELMYESKIKNISGHSWKKKTRKVKEPMDNPENKLINVSSNSHVKIKRTPVENESSRALKK